MILPNQTSIHNTPASAPIDIPLIPLVDDHGMVLLHTPPSPMLLTPLIFGDQVETPVSWPPSDDMNIETHTPPRLLGASGSTPWLPIITLSRDSSPFWPGGPNTTPEKGMDTIPTVGLGENPGSPLVSMPEYNYNLMSPLSPKDSSPMLLESSSTSSPATSPDNDYKGCTKYCFDMAYTLHHHDHSTAEPTWTTATMIEERPQKHPIVWGYGLKHEKEPTWE
jgi:hypothetical protein